MLAEHTERLARDVVRVGDREHEIAALRAGHATDTRELLRREELRDLRLDRLAGERELRQAFGALALGDRGEVVDFLSRVVARGNDEVARAGGIGPDQVGGLDLPKPALDHEVADEVDDLVPETHELPRTFSPKIDVAILPAEVLVDLRLLVHIEGRGLRLVQ